MKRTLQRYGLFALLVTSGALLGVPAGYMLADRQVARPSPSLESLNLTLPKGYFANLPKASGESERLIPVDTYTFGDAGMEPVVLPRLVMDDIPPSEQKKFMQLKK